jgi:threonine dehydrogenase-like Zn-dependent dehydrogenase
MKAVVYHGVGDIRLEDVPEPKIRERTDAIVRLTASSICGTDLHFVRGTVPGMVPGTILGHEGVGLVEEIGRDVRNLKRGDRVVIPSTIACGTCSYCRCGYFAQCDQANPNGPQAGTCFFGGPASSGSIDGLQAEFARVPFANVGLVRVPENVTNDEAILLSDIFPTGYFGAALAEVRSGDTVAVFGCGPVGLFAIVSSFLRGAGQVIAVDTLPSRLEMAQRLGAQTVDFNAEDPVAAIRTLTGGIGVDRAIDAVGVDAVRPKRGTATKVAKDLKKEFEEELKEVAPKQNCQGPNWHPGDGPSQALRWSVEALAKAGTLSIIGIYPDTMKSFPIGKAMGKNLTVQMGNCHHRAMIPKLLRLIQGRTVDPVMLLTQEEPLMSALDAYRAFDTRQPGWIKVKLEPPLPADTHGEAA